MSGSLMTKDEIEKYCDWMTSMSYSPRTIEEYKRDLRAFELWSRQLDTSTWDKVESAAATYLKQYDGTWKPNSIRRRMATFRSFAKWSGHPGLLGNYRAPKPLPPQPHPLAHGQPGVVAMCEAARSPKQAALCALTGLMGLRVSEAISIGVQSIDTTRMELVVVGKGNKHRRVPISPLAWKYLQPSYNRCVRKGAHSLAEFSQSGARRSIEIQAKRAGIAQHVKSHDMRSTFATEAYARSKDIRAVQELLGHASINTTQVYVEVSEDRLRQAAGG